MTSDPQSVRFDDPVGTTTHSADPSSTNPGKVAFASFIGTTVE